MMSTRLSDDSTRECWNCEKPTDRPVQVVVRSPTGGQSTLMVCPDCYESVYLPLVQGPADESSDEPRHEMVLVVEDDPDTLNVLEWCLEEAGFTVSTAKNGAEALERARHRVPDAIVLDMLMPVMSGSEFLIVWRRNAPSRSVPIVAMSAFGRDQFTADLGVHAFLSKPFAPDALVSVIAAALRLQ
jgi:CheY-like chemotaxis protein